jgi:hypothetical protein
MSAHDFQSALGQSHSCFPHRNVPAIGALIYALFFTGRSGKAQI